MQQKMKKDRGGGGYFYRALYMPACMLNCVQRGTNVPQRCVLFVCVARLQRETWSLAPPLTTPWLCGRTWSTSLSTSTALPQTPFTPSTCMVPRSSPATWPTRSASTPWWTSRPALPAWPSSAPRISAGPSPAWLCCPQRGCFCWAQRTAPSGYWLESQSPQKQQQQQPWAVVHECPSP